MRHRDRVRRDLKLQALMVRPRVLGAFRNVPHAFQPALRVFVDKRLGLRPSRHSR